MISIPLLWGLVLRLSGASRTVADGCGVRNFQGSSSVSHHESYAETYSKSSRGRRLHRQCAFRRHPQTACRCRTSAGAGETPASASASPQGRARRYAGCRAVRREAAPALGAESRTKMTPPTTTCVLSDPALPTLARRRSRMLCRGSAVRRAVDIAERRRPRTQGSQGCCSAVSPACCPGNAVRLSSPTSFTGRRSG